MEKLPMEDEVLKTFQSRDHERRGTEQGFCESLGCPSNPHTPRHDELTVKMDITKFIVELREAAFLLGDHGTYREQLSRRLRTVRKKLGRATAKNAKYSAKPPVTAEEIGRNTEYDDHFVSYQDQVDIV